jgi:predicted ABC-type ATPase
VGAAERSLQHYVSRLDLVVGPNGAGKSTFVSRILSPQLPAIPFVNADLIAAQYWPADPERHAYEAALLAEDTRAELVGRGQPFIAETVFSHPSKLELIAKARAAGYFVALHVLLIPEDLAVARVEYRILAGGHSVPEDKIRSRYQRLWPLVVQAGQTGEAADFWDNAQPAGPELVASLSRGQRLAASNWPRWTPPELVAAW